MLYTYYTWHMILTKYPDINSVRLAVMTQKCNYMCKSFYIEGVTGC